MLIMRMSYNDLSKNGGEAKLHVYGLGTFPVFLVGSRTQMIPTVPTLRTVQYLLVVIGWLTDREVV